MKLTKKIVIVLLIALAAIQFYRPEKNESAMVPETDFIATTHPPQFIENTVRMACYDCHSNTTNYPWYATIAPISYWLSDHIEDGKAHLNFSVWDIYTTKKKIHKLEEIIETITEDEMPLKSYRWMHREAELSDQQIRKITHWANTLIRTYQ